MATDGLIGLTHDKMKVTADDQKDINQILSATQIPDQVRILGKWWTVSTGKITIPNGTVIMMNGRLVKAVKDLVLNFTYTSGLKLYLVFDSKLENTATGEVGTSSYIPVLNQSYFTFSTTVPAGVEAAVIADITSDSSAKEGKHTTRNLHFWKSDSMLTGKLLPGIAIVYDKLFANTQVHASWYSNNYQLPANDNPGYIPNTALGYKTGKVGEPDSGVNFRYEKSGNNVTIKFAGTRTARLSFGTIIKSFATNTLENLGISPISNENWGQAEMEATSSGVKLEAKSGGGWNIVWRGGTVSANHWMDGSINYITKDKWV